METYIHKLTDIVFEVSNKASQIHIGDHGSPDTFYWVFESREEFVSLDKPLAFFRIGALRPTTSHISTTRTFSRQCALMTGLRQPVSQRVARVNLDKKLDRTRNAFKACAPFDCVFFLCASLFRHTVLHERGYLALQGSLEKVDCTNERRG